MTAPQATPASAWTGRTAVIVGGGIVGVAAFISQVRHRSASKIYIVDPRPVGVGRAFATTEDRLLTNTSVDTLSVIADNKDDFLDYLRTRGVDADSASCVPRYYVTQYARDRYAHYSGVARECGIAQKEIRRKATAVRKDGHRYRVTIDDGDVIDADYVLICCGFVGPAVPEALRNYIGEDRLFACPYPEGAIVESLPKNSHVLILGTRLSAIDMALLLCGLGHSAVMASRTGQLPAVRTRLLRQLPCHIDEAAFRALDFTSPSLYKALLKIICRAVQSDSGCALSSQISRSTDIVLRLRQEVELAATARNNWQNIIIGLLELANTVLAAGPPDIQRRAIENCWAMVQRYLFSFPLRNAQALLRFVEESRLRIIARVPRRIEKAAAKWRITWPEDDAAEEFDAIVCATGFHRPRFDANADSLDIVTDDKRRCAEPEVLPDLRVKFRHRESAEQIWLIGVSSYLRMPLVSIVYQCAQQAEAVAASLMPANLPIADPETLAAAPCQEDAMTIENLRGSIAPRLQLGDGVDIADGVRVFPIDIRTGERTAPFKSTVFSVAAGQSTPPDKHDVAEMWVVLKGGGMLEYEGEAMRIAEQDRLFFPSQRLHKVTNDSQEPLQILSIYW